MTRITDLCHPESVRVAASHQAEAKKIAAETICRWLTADQRHDYQAWTDNDRRLREPLTRLEALGTEALESDPRRKR